MLARHCALLAVLCVWVVLGQAEEYVHDTFPGSPPQVTKVTSRWVTSNPKFVTLPPEEDANVTRELDYQHMGMLEVFPDGSLVAVWQGSTASREGSEFQGIYMACSNSPGARGEGWSSPVLLVPPVDGVPPWAPVLHVETGIVWLFYAVSRPQCFTDGPSGRQYGFGGDLMMTSSSDSGQTWSDAMIIYSYDVDGGIGKMISNKLEIGADGRWMLPFWREMSGPDECKRVPEMHGKPGVLITSDQGQTWTSVDVQLDSSSKATWLIENSISFLTVDQSMVYMQYFRTKGGFVYFSTSTDEESWAPATPTSLPNPDSKMVSMTLPDGRVLLAFNDDPTQRTALTLASTSSPNGQEYQRHIVIHPNDPVAVFSYPTLQYLPEEQEVLVIYTVLYPPAEGEQGGTFGKNCYGLQVAVVPLDAIATFAEPQYLSVDVSNPSDTMSSLENLVENTNSGGGNAMEASDVEEGVGYVQAHVEISATTGR